MSYARARLWLGITGVGTVVVLCVLFLALRLPAVLLPTGTQFVPRDVVALATVLFVYAAVQGAFDFFGGHILPTEYARTTRPFAAFLMGWLRGGVCHSAMLLAVGLTLLTAARWGGFWGTFGAFAGWSVVLIAAQSAIAAIIGGVSYRRDTGEKRTVIASSESPYFTGGIAGLPGFETVILPARWGMIFSPEAQTAIRLRKRETVRSGARTRGLALALGFNSIGFALAYAAGGGTASVAGLVATSLYFTLWSFVGLLMLPTPSKRGVFEADHRAVAAGASTDTLTNVIQTLDRDQDDEPARPNGVETVFHPLPSVERRLARLAMPETGGDPGAWHAARMAIYLSWAGMSLLSRSVHCNAGRPDAWVFLPSD
ncbi:MAG: hypothetical protein H7Y38_02835 [Armatimonadetes bacterium]|nr:hypothetical protein [Armatimonadota bacterium]